MATSALEGTYAILDDVLQAEVSDTALHGDVGEVVNYAHAVERGIALLEAGRPITLNLITSSTGC